MGARARMTSWRRVRGAGVGAAVAAAVVLGGCASSRPEGEALPPAELVVMAYWLDPENNKALLVGSVRCVVERVEAPSVLLEQLTDAGEPLVFPDLPPGEYELTAHGGAVAASRRSFELEPGESRTVYVDVRAALAHQDEVLADGASPLQVVRSRTRRLLAPARQVVIELLRPDEADRLESLFLEERPYDPGRPVGGASGRSMDVEPRAAEPGSIRDP